MSGSEKTDVTIIGAGLTGLTLAFYLKRAGCKVTLVEQSERTGGVIGTRSEAGFVYETGPNTGVLANPEIVELFEDLGGSCELEKARQYANSRWIWKEGNWHALPGGLLQAINTPLFTLKDKFRILGEPFRKKGNDPFETVAELVIRRLGTSYLNYAVDPFISGIYAGDPSRLVTRYALPKLYQLEQQYGSFIRGAILKQFKAKDKRDKKATREVFSVKGGLQNLTGALGRSVGEEHILTGCEGVIIKPFERGFITEIRGRSISLSSDRVVITTGGLALPGLLPFLSRENLAPVSELRYAGIVQVAAGFHNWNGISPDAFGGLIPSRENRKVLGILFPSSLFAGRASGNSRLFSVFLGGTRNPEIINKSDDEIINMVVDEVRETMRTTSAMPDLVRVFRYTHAIPQYERSSAERLACIKELENRYPGLILAGNIRDGIGIADRVKQARMIVNLIAP